MGLMDYYNSLGRYYVGLFIIIIIFFFNINIGNILKCLIVLIRIACVYLGDFIEILQILKNRIKKIISKIITKICKYYYLNILIL